MALIVPSSYVHLSLQGQEEKRVMKVLESESLILVPGILRFILIINL